MNERIKELVEQTYLYDTYETVNGEQQKVYGFTKNNLQKFADLIVKECMSMCDEPGVYSKIDMENAIRRHFGVKS